LLPHSSLAKPPTFCYRSPYSPRPYLFSKFCYPNDIKVSSHIRCNFCTRNSSNRTACF
jgi:hypothetical protein